MVRQKLGSLMDCVDWSSCGECFHIPRLLNNSVDLPEKDTRSKSWQADVCCCFRPANIIRDGIGRDIFHVTSRLLKELISQKIATHRHV